MRFVKGTFAVCTRTGARFVVISGSMFNDVDAYPHVIVMEVLDAADEDFTYPYFVPVERGGAQWWVKITSQTEYPKALLEVDAAIERLSADEITRTHTALFRILSWS